MWDSTCRWARPRLALLAGGELTGDDRRKAERHLITCGDCRSRLGSLRESLGALQLVATESAPSPEAPSLWPALARQMREARHPEPTVFAFRPMWMGLGIAASALMVGLTTWSLVKGRDGSSARLAASNSAQSAPAVVKLPTPVAESSPSATVADAAPNSRPEGDEALASAPSRGRNTPPAGRIGVEPTH
jgi:anti-sigma factor RsiW